MELWWWFVVHHEELVVEGNDPIHVAAEEVGFWLFPFIRISKPVNSQSLAAFQLQLSSAAQSSSNQTQLYSRLSVGLDVGFGRIVHKMVKAIHHK